ncbi:MAG: phenylalanine--tRNA ligase subunit alpha, partial [bacterium]|nr:phenylalanine--tRNA ligase subunit alpha [bacterium]
MSRLKEQIQATENDFQQSLKQSQTIEELEQVRIAFLGRNGTIAELMANLKTLSNEEKKIFGPALNTLKIQAQHAFDVKEKQLLEAALAQEQERQKQFDVSAYHYEPVRGSMHVYSYVIEQLEDIFISMGYEIADGPEVETDHNNFGALNIPADHPARDMQDTFWLHLPNMLLRTHTSPVQIRSMESKGVPIALFAPGRVYRHEETDASHDFLFMQGEILLVDKNISMGNLLATARAFLQAFFEKKDLDIRVRPGYFPFVEPGVEIDF